MGIIIDTALHQVRALGLSIALSLDNITGSVIGPQSPSDVVDWVKEQGLAWDFGVPDAEDWIIWKSMHHYVLGKLRAGLPETTFAKVLRVTFSEEFDHPGAKRSGAGIHKDDNFIITSGLVRLLGAHEQYQVDVLKALFYHRPGGCLGHESEQILQDASPDVAFEEPESNEVFSKPPLWTWVKKHAENNVERAKIFSHVFGINEFKPKKLSIRPWKDWYDLRNCIAHGRKGVEVVLKEYCDAEALVVASIMDLAEQCERTLKLRV